RSPARSRSAEVGGRHELHAGAWGCQGDSRAPAGDPSPARRGVRGDPGRSGRAGDGHTMKTVAEFMATSLLTAAPRETVTAVVRRLTDHGIGGLPVLERSEEHTSELQSRFDLVCRLLLEKKKQKNNTN